MDSNETKNDMISPNSSDSAPLQDSTIHSSIRDLSPVKPLKGATMEQSFPGRDYSPHVFTSPRISPQIQSKSLERPQYYDLSSEYSKKNGDKNDDVASVICTPGKLNTNLSYQVNSHGVGPSSNSSALGEGGIASESDDKYWEYLFKAIRDDVGNVTNSRLKQSDTATPSSKDFAECINNSCMIGEQHNGHVRIEVSQQMPDGPTCCLQYDETQQNAVAENCSSKSQSNAACISSSVASQLQVLESSSAPIYAPSNSVELENISKPTSSMFHAPKFGRSSIAVPKLSGCGLHLNSILSALPMGCGASASVKSAEENFMILQGQKSLCTTDSHSAENTGNSSTSSKAIDDLLNPTEHHSTSGDKREYTKLNPQKKRKRSTGFSDGDGCKRCNCKKTKCLKLYCDCFAAGYYCAETCSCQGCFNSPEYEDTVLDTRKKIVSRDPLAFAPKTLQLVGESPASNIQDINKATPSSVRHKRGCNCKKSMCLKRYCECYQSNVGCSDGCRCDGCQNVYGKKEEYDSCKHIAIPEATLDIPEISFDQKFDTLHSELSIPHNIIPFTPLPRYLDSLGKDALPSLFADGRCRQSPEADIALSATHEKPSISTKCSDNHKMIGGTYQTIPGLESSDMQLYKCNSKRVDDFLPHRRGNNSLNTHHNPRSMAVACLTSQTTKVMTNDTSCQPCPQSGSFSSLSSRQLCSSPLTSVVPFCENKLPMDLDSDSRCYSISEDDDIPEVLKEHPISFSEVKVRSPNKKRVSPPHDCFREIRSSSSITALGGGRKFVLKAVPSFPPLAPCTGGKSSPSKPALTSNNMK